MKYIKLLIEYIVDFILVHCFIGVIWLNNDYGYTTGDEKIFHLLVPLNGVNSECFYDYIFKAIIPTLFVAAIILYLRRKKLNKLIYIPFAIISLTFALYDLDLIKYFKENIQTSNIIEENYVSPDSVNIKFKDKKNLIFIYLESMENTYSSTDKGGVMKDNLIPNLTTLAEDNISFSNTNKLGGALYLNGSGFTVGSMMAQTTGLPLKVQYSKKGIPDFQKFLLGKSLGDILYENGYDNYIIMGSDSRYGSRNKLFTNHHYKLFDLTTAINEHKMKKQDKVWWGFSDKKLFNFAKEELKTISKNNKPFNYTMLTVDTHFEDGYLDETCEKKYDEQYANVISCNDNMLNDFLNWIKKQDFYKDTVVILVGDHISMDQDFFDNVDEDYIRTTYNVFLNIDKKGNFNNRLFSQLDMFPTTLVSIGADIEGDKLGLGTNLFSNKKTLVEEKGYDCVKEELDKRSEFYNNFLAHK